MELEEFYIETKHLLPYRIDSSLNFKLRLKIALSKYEELANSYIVDTDVLDDIKDISKRLIDIVAQYEKGLHSSAYVKLQYLIQGKKGFPPKIDLMKTILQFEENKHISFYRIRVMESIYERKADEMFHIPLSMRGIVKTQRYSAPGYPCLYLGESIYGCWEEMRRPTMQSCAVSRLECNKELNIIDLSVPNQKEYLDIPEYQKLMPLLISCMIPVVNHSDTYKPEYIIPQLIIQWVLKNRKSKNIDGICYTSTHINSEFEFPDEKFINYAFPVYNIVNRHRFCHHLCDLFQVTDPTTNELEKLKGNYGINAGTYGEDMEEDERKAENYTISDFGNLEKRLLDTDKFPLRDIKYK